VSPIVAPARDAGLVAPAIRRPASDAAVGSAAAGAGDAEVAGAADQQTLDARALADVMTSNAPAPGARGPTGAVTSDHRARRARGPAGVQVATRAGGAWPAAAPEVAPRATTEAAAEATTNVVPRAAIDATGEVRLPGAALISRGELDSALADFAALTAAVHASFSAAGVTVDSVGDGTIFQRAGLRGGDVITAVDGVRLRSLDDAANLYARAPTAKAVTAQIVRGGKPMTLHVVIQ
jgi:hypothetical protein